MPTAQNNPNPPDVEIDLHWVVSTLGLEGCAVLVALGLLLLGSTKLGRRAMRAAGRRLARYIRVTVWGARLGIGYRLASRLQIERWDGMVNARKLPGLKRGKVRRTPGGIAIRLTLNGALDLDAVRSRTSQLETGLGLRRGSARIKPTSRADKAVLDIVLRDPLAKPILWQPPKTVVRLTDPVKLSITPFGDAVTLDVKQRLGIFGTSGSGKSCVQRLLGAHVVQAVDADLEIWDLKFGVESEHYEGKAHRVTTVEDAVARVDWLLDQEFPRRAAIMTAKGTSTWKETPSDRALVVMVDEGNVIIREFTTEQKKRFFRVAEQGRALGCYLIWATQYPKATNLPTELRSQLNVRICLKLNSSEESELVFKEEAGQGWEPHRLRGVGWLLIKSDNHREPEESKAIWLSESVFRTIGTKTLLEPAQAAFPPRPTYDPTVHLNGPQIPAQTPVVPEVKKPERAKLEVKVTVADEIRMALGFSPEPLGNNEIARQIGRDRGAVSRAIAKLADAGEVTANQDKKYSLVLTTADQADRTKGSEA
jgi:hypothetical protein